MKRWPEHRSAVVSGTIQAIGIYPGRPVGFLVVERLAIRTLGNNEYALRLFPLLSGILSRFLFHKIARQLLKRRAALIALALLAILEPLIYYASEVKQYSTDVAVTLLVYFVAIKFYETAGVTRDRLPGRDISSSACLSWLAGQSDLTSIASSRLYCLLKCVA